MNLKSIANPFTTFSISWALCLLIYSLGWAQIYPKIQNSLLIFLGSFIVLFGIIGLIFNRVKILSVNTNYRCSNNKLLLVVNSILWLGNFAYSGMPILTGLRDNDFGLPTIIVISTSLTSFLSVYFFYQFLQTGKKKFFIAIFYCLSFFVIEISRGYILMSLLNMFFVWLVIKKPKLDIIKAIYLIIGTLLFLYLFGVAGNLRVAKDVASWKPGYDDSYTSKPILEIGQESEYFEKSTIPDEFFWTYLYFSSPLSNLQYNIENSNVVLSLTGLVTIFQNEVLWDALSKRLSFIVLNKKPEPQLITPQLAVSTTLVNSYLYSGWIGMVFFLLILIVIPFIYMLITINNPLNVIGLSILCTMYLFSVFDNMLILSGLSFQLVLPSFIYQFNKISFLN